MAQPKSRKTTTTRNLRFDPELLYKWKCVMDAAEDDGAFPPGHKRSLSGDINMALLSAVTMAEGKTPDMRKFMGGSFEQMSHMVNVKVAQMIESLCEAMDLNMTPILRPDGHLELVIGGRGSFILPKDHFRHGTLSEDDEQHARLGEFITAGKPN